MDTENTAIAGQSGGVRLNKTTVERLPAPATGYTIYMDDGLPGFGVRVTARGVKTYFIERRIKGNKRRISIGRAKDISADFARNQAKVIAGQIAAGADPVAEKRRDKLESLKLGEALSQYIGKRDLKPRTASDMRQAFAESFEDWQEKQVTKITRKMVEARYLQRVSKSKARANVAFRYLRAVFNFVAASHRDAENRPIVTDNPVATLSEQKLWRKVPRRRTVMSPDDLKTWLPAVNALAEVPEREPGTGRENPKLRHGEVQRDLLLFLALTGARKGEALGLRKSDVDLRRRVLVFGDTKNRTDLELPLQGELLALVKRSIKRSASQLVFGSPFDGSPPTNLRYAVQRITAITGLHFTPHDLRRLTASTLERLGVQTYTVKAILNHLTAATDVTGGYVQVDLAMKREALQRLEDFILGQGRG